MSSSVSVSPETTDGDLPVTVSYTPPGRSGPRPRDSGLGAGRAQQSRELPEVLGGGWARLRGDADEWHMLCRFADQRAPAAWEATPERQWWLRSAQGLAEVTRTDGGQVSRAGSTSRWTVRSRRRPGPRSAPPHGKQATTNWLVFFPLCLLTTVTLGELLTSPPVVARVAITTLVLTPVMTYLVPPWVTARRDWWLHGRSWRDR